MKRAWEGLAAALRAGEDAVLCTVLEASGSTPRGAGAKMTVLADGSSVGTIGGGAVEHACCLRAAEVLRCGQSRVAQFHLRNDDAAGLGMVCGGSLTVFLQYFQASMPDRLALAEAALVRLAEAADSWLVAALAADGTWSVEIVDACGGLPESLRLYLGRRPVLWGESPRCYAEPLGRAGRIYLFGGGHVSQALTPVLSRVDFSVVVCEDRAEFADPVLFPAAEAVLLLGFEKAMAHFSIREADGIVVMTRGHQNDYQILRQALETDAGYLGVIGSRTKAAATFEQLRAEGFAQAVLDRVHTPIGLPIGAETPEEIAISIAAELIRWRAVRTGGRGKL